MHTLPQKDTDTTAQNQQEMLGTSINQNHKKNRQKLAQASDHLRQGGIVEHELPPCCTAICGRFSGCLGDAELEEVDVGV